MTAKHRQRVRQLLDKTAVSQVDEVVVRGDRSTGYFVVEDARLQSLPKEENRPCDDVRAAGEEGVIKKLQLLLLTMEDGEVDWM